MSKFHFIDNWTGDLHEFATLREAKRAAKSLTHGYQIAITKERRIVAVVEPNENPLP